MCPSNVDYYSAENTAPEAYYNVEGRPGHHSNFEPSGPVDAKQKPFNLFAMLGDQVPKFYNKDTRMGAWTGLPPIYGAPLSGALWGAGLGAAYGGISSLLSGEDEEPVPWYKKPWLLGSLLGAGVGLYAGADKGPLLEKKEAIASCKQASSQRQDLARLVLEDSRLSGHQREVTLRALSVLPDYKLRHAVASLGVGALTGMALYKLFGASGLFSSVGGLISAHVYNNYAAPKYYL